MLKAATFNEFAFACPFFTSQPWVNNGYGCKHSMQAEQRQDSEGNVGGCCYCWSCPIGIEAEQEDLSNPNIDWDDLCAEGEVAESEYILINVGSNASDNEKAAWISYKNYIHRYDSEWKNNRTGSNASA